MFRSVLPPVASVSAEIAAVTISDVAGADVRVPDEIIIVVDGDVVSSPARAPTPASTPPCAHSHSDAE
jgi:hypothetical protein